MEHISRLTTHNVDVLLLVSDTSRRSLQAAARINQLSKSLNIGVGKSFLVVNQAKNGLSKEALDLIASEELTLAGSIPDDTAIYDFDFQGRPTIDIPEQSPALKAAFDIFDKIIQ